MRELLVTEAWTHCLCLQLQPTTWQFVAYIFGLSLRSLLSLLLTRLFAQDATGCSNRLLSSSDCEALSLHIPGPISKHAAAEDSEPNQ